jgi:hypothetical protein
VGFDHVFCGIWRVSKTLSWKCTLRSVKDGSLGVGGKDKARGRVKDGKDRGAEEKGKTGRRVKDGKAKGVGEKG